MIKIKDGVVATVLEGAIDKLRSFTAVFICLRLITLGTCCFRLIDLGADKKKSLATAVILQRKSEINGRVGQWVGPFQMIHWRIRCFAWYLWKRKIHFKEFLTFAEEFLRRWISSECKFRKVIILSDRNSDERLSETLRIIAFCCGTFLLAMLNCWLNLGFYCRSLASDLLYSLDLQIIFKCVLFALIFLAISYISISVQQCCRICWFFIFFPLFFSLYFCVKYWQHCFCVQYWQHWHDILIQNWGVKFCEYCTNETHRKHFVSHFQHVSIVKTNASTILSFYCKYFCIYMPQ